MNWTSGVVPLLAFAGVLVLIPLSLWLLKRTPLGAGSAQGAMRVVAVLPLSPQQRLYTVEVGLGDERRWLVLGATPAAISTLHTMAPQADAPVATPVLAPFAKLLARQRNAQAAETPHAS